MKKTGNITQLLAEYRAGNQEALGEVFPLVYNSLRRMAQAQLRQERPGHTLQATALVNEAVLKLMEMNQVNVSDRAHLFALAATSMRRILIDYGRHRMAAKRGGHMVRVVFEENIAIDESSLPNLIAIDDALTALAKTNLRLSRVVELRFFGGLTAEESAEALGITIDLVRRDWRKAKLWLFHALKDEKAVG